MGQEKTIDLKFNGRIIRAFFFLFIGLLGLSYVLVFNWSFMPGGYDFVSKEGHAVTVVQYDLLGQEEGYITKDFSEEPTPHAANYIEPSIDRLKFNYFLQMFIIVMSIILLFYNIKVKGETIWKSILNSGIVINLLPVINIINNLERIQSLMS